MSSYSRFNCKLCGEKFQGGVHLIRWDLEAHLAKVHPRENEDLSANEYNRSFELSALEKELWNKYPLTLGSFFDSVEVKHTKAWICPKCRREVSPHSKRYHVNNPLTQCVRVGGR